MAGVVEVDEDGAGAVASEDVAAVPSPPQAASASRDENEAARAKRLSETGMV